MNVTQKRLKKLLHYNPKTGFFRWRVKGWKLSSADTACYNSGGGYRAIFLDKRPYLAHRLAWLYIYGKDPVVELDHINGKPWDNRISNLRKADRITNMQNQKRCHSNNRSGLLGVSWHNKLSKWYARIKLNKKEIYLGLFETKEAAHSAYIFAKRQLHEFNTL